MDILGLALASVLVFLIILVKIMSFKKIERLEERNNKAQNEITKLNALLVKNNIKK
ncbi:MAG: hypothetical protein HAW67_01385 [Endozoicomonadaceae bacterium]|nr:hypothetical protein [Endozoicomonadaceae bacterium]